MRVLVVEDEPKLVQYLHQGLSENGYVVDVARDGIEGRRLATGGSYDLMLLDVMLPGVDGLEICRRARAMARYTPIIITSARSSEMHRILGLELGADDYVSKPFSPREVCARVKAILRRSAGRAPVAAPSPETAPLLQLDEAAQRIRCAGQWLALTRYEYRLLATLLKRPQRIFSRAELMDLVWDDAPDTADRTVDAHIKLVRAKLREAGASAELIQTHRHMGYSLSF